MSPATPAGHRETTTTQAKASAPPSTKRDRIVSVDDDPLPNESQVAHSAMSVSQADPSPVAESQP
jgi:hypothetical protein